jgi:gas vesicle protein
MKKKAALLLTFAGVTICIFNLFYRSKRKAIENNYFIAAVIGCIAGALLIGCEKTPEEQVKNVKENAGEIKQDLKDARTDFLAEWQTFKSEAERTIAANGKRIDTLKAKAEKVDAGFKSKYTKDVAVLERKNRNLEKELIKFDNKGQNEWKEFKTKFKRDLDDIGNSAKDLFKDNS